MREVIKINKPRTFSVLGLITILAFVFIAMILNTVAIFVSPSSDYMELIILVVMFVYFSFVFFRSCQEPMLSFTPTAIYLESWGSCFFRMHRVSQFPFQKIKSEDIQKNWRPGALYSRSII